MKKKTAILVDAEWFRKLLKRALTAAISQQASAITTTVTTQVLPAITADTFYRNACLALDTTEEELFRFFCYDCEPFDKPQRNPIDHSWVRFGSGNPKYIERMTFFRELGAMPFVALRRGIVKGRGWEIRDNVANALLTATQTNVALAATDIQYGLEQKGVDMRIGMDFATLSLKRLVDRIILLSGDTDMVPAMKLARREGVQVCVVQIGNGGRLAPQLIEDADIVRCINPTP